jgi:hypothetical protein
MTLREENAKLRAENADLWSALERGEHPIRARILRWLDERPNGSPIQFAKSIDGQVVAGKTWTVSAIAYHFRTLQRKRLIKVTRTRPVRGTVEHFYARSRPK